MKKVLSIALVLIMVVCLPMTTLAAVIAEGAKVPTTSETNARRSTNKEYNVVDFGAKGDGRNNDGVAIQRALDINKSVRVNDASSAITIRIPAGTYQIGRKLSIYSNTRLIVDKNARLVRNDINDCLIVGMKRNNNEAVGGYGQFKNITIEGGIWDGNDIRGRGHAAIMRFRHGSDVTFKNMIIQNGTEHFVNSSASQNILFDGCTFRNAREYKGNNKVFWGSHKNKDRRFLSIEAIHLDSATSKDSDPQDNTVCRNITVRNCTFDRVYTAIGNHHVNKKYRTQNVVIENNTFKNILYAAVWADSFAKITVRNNTATNVGLFMRAEDSKGTITNNKISGNVRNFVPGLKLGEVSRIQLYSGSSFTIRGNNIKGGTLNGIAVFTGEGRATPSKAMIENNTISGARKNGVHIADSRGVTIRKNTISKSKEAGVYIDRSTKTVINNNKITNNTDRGVVVAGSNDAKVTKNTITGNKDRGIVVSRKSKKVSITGNVVTGNKGSVDIGLYENSTGTVKKNTVTELRRIVATQGTKFTVADNTASKGNNSNTRSTFTIQYRKNGATSGKMATTKVTHGTKTKLRTNAFERTGHKFRGWNMYRKSDKTWFYSRGSKSGWYRKGKQPSGYKLKLIKNGATMSKEGQIDRDVIIMHAVWRKR